MDAPASEPRRLRGSTAAVAFIALVAITTVAGAGLLPAPEQLREDVRDWGATGVVIVIVLALAHAVIPYPAEILCLAAGYAYGAVAGIVLMLASLTLSCLLAYVLAQRYGPRLAGRLVEAGALARAGREVSGAHPLVLLALRVIPIVPINLVSYAAGTFRVPLGRFSWTTALGIAPQFSLATYAGSRAQEISPTEPWLWAVAAGWFSLVGIGMWMRRRGRPREA